MRASLVPTLFFVLIGFLISCLSSSAFACAIACRAYYDNCLAAGGGTAPQCRILYLASTKDGGVWGSAAARAASKTSGNAIRCRVDFE
jgi:hypothetical protein